MKTVFTFTFFCFLTLTTFGGVKEAKRAWDDENYPVARKEYTALADKGDTDAMIILGRFYQQGEGTPQDYTRAMDWYLKAFEKRNGDAYNYIGVMYRDGLGVTKNGQIAYALFWMTYWQRLGNEATQIRGGQNLEKTAHYLSKAQLDETLKMTSEYVKAYVQQRGTVTPEIEKLKFAATGHPIKTMGELGAPTDRRENHDILVELRIPQDVKFDDKRAVEFVTEEGVTSTPIHSLKRREEQSYVILSASFLSFSEARHAVMVRTSPTSPTQVFPLPKADKASDWSAWMKPSYVETSDAPWTFMQNMKNAERSTALPKDCFEVRYKVAKTRNAELGTRK